MPYNLTKYKTGYRICKKNSSKCFSKKPLTKENAKSQMKALYANESLIKENLSTKYVGSNLEYKSTIENSIKGLVTVTYKIKSESGTDLRIVYTLGKDLIHSDYLEFHLHDHDDLKGEPKTFVDPESKEAKRALKFYKLTSEDVLKAGQDGYDKLQQYFTNKSEENSSASKKSRFPYEESLNFDKVYNKIAHS
jgi:hypothetical protein